MAAAILTCTATAASGRLEIRSLATLPGHPALAVGHQPSTSGRLHLVGRTGQLFAASPLRPAVPQTLPTGAASCKGPLGLGFLLGPLRAGHGTGARIEPGTGRAIACLLLSPEPSGRPGGYAVHPAALDASTHTAAALAGGTGTPPDSQYRMLSLIHSTVALDANPVYADVCLTACEWNERRVRGWRQPVSRLVKVNYGLGQLSTTLLMSKCAA